MTLQEAKEYDAILGQLKKDGKQTEVNVPRGTELYQQWVELEARGLVALIKGGNKIALAKLTHQGISFMVDGGFEKQLRGAEKEEHRQNKPNRIAIWAIVIAAIVSILVSLKEELQQLIAWILSFLS